MIANLRTLGKFLDPQILPGERSGTFRDSGNGEYMVAEKGQQLRYFNLPPNTSRELFYLFQVCGGAKGVASMCPLWWNSNSFDK